MDAIIPGLGTVVWFSVVVVVDTGSYAVDEAKGVVVSCTVVVAVDVEPIAGK
jgi:hypothetical protein